MEADTLKIDLKILNVEIAEVKMNENVGTNNYCRVCGESVEPAQKVCTKCGFEPDYGDAYCLKCGVNTKKGQSLCTNCGYFLNQLETEHRTLVKTPLIPDVARRYCKSCGSSIKEGQKVCTSCGFEPLTGSSFCQTCGVGVKEGQVICVKCGFDLNSTNIKNENSNVDSEDDLIKAIFSILIPIVGIIFYFIYFDKNRNRANKFLSFGMLSFLISYIFFNLW